MTARSAPGARRRSAERLVDNSADPSPASFALNSVTCTADDAQSLSPSQPHARAHGPDPDPPTGSLPGSFTWSSSGVLISPHSDSHNIIAVKDPSVVNFNGEWYVAASTVNSSGDYGMEFLSFSNWSQAASAVPVYADQTAIGGGYKTAPSCSSSPRRSCGT